MKHLSVRMRVALALAAAVTAVSPATAQSGRMIAIPTPSQPSAIDLRTGPLAGATATESWYRQYDRSFVRNVTIATLTPYLPDRPKANGTAVIVAPGGGFRSLSIENEGSDVARALAAKGVAAFVLKYRLVQTPAAIGDFEHAMAAMFSGVGRRPTDGGGSAASPSLAPQLADARAAFALVRQHAVEWHVDPNRIGMVGFSAGAMLTLQTVLQSGDARPAFIGLVYGPVGPVTVPTNAPPMFVALAADDPLFGGRGFGLVEAWMTAKRPVEFHLYEQGGHGFGMYPKTTTSTGWFDDFVAWLQMHGMMRRD